MRSMSDVLLYVISYLVGCLTGNREREMALTIGGIEQKI